MTSAPRVDARCAVHPARLAADRCPICGRDRCGADASIHGEQGCAACVTSRRGARPAGLLEVVTRAGLAGLAAALAGGWVATQHVGVHLMSLFAPGLVGLAASWATAAASAARDVRQRRAVLAVAAVAALLGTALAYRLFPLSPLHPVDQVGPPYLAALGGVLAWPLIFGSTPSRRGRVP
jgi:hypothetical protein